MPMEQVHVEIDKVTGIMKIEGEGFIGTGCKVLEEVELSMGKKISYQEKDEMYNHLQPDYLPNQLA